MHESKISSAFDELPQNDRGTGTAMGVDLRASIDPSFNELRAQVPAREPSSDHLPGSGRSGPQQCRQAEFPQNIDTNF